MRHNRPAARWLATLTERAVSRYVVGAQWIGVRRHSEVHWDETSKMREIAWRAIPPRRLATLLDGS